MPWFSAFDDFGMLDFSSEPNPAEKIYDQLVLSYGPAFSGDVNDSRVYAMAMCLGVAQTDLALAGNESNPLDATYTLAAQERESGLYAAADATLRDRRRALADSMLIRNSSRRDVVVDGLRAMLGSSFVAYITNETDNPAVPAPFPAALASPGTFKPQKTPITVVRLGTTVSSTGAHTVNYTVAASPETALHNGDSLVVSAGRPGCHEAVTISEVTPTSFRATFTLPHEIGDLCTTAPYPYQWSMQRNVLVVVAASVIGDPPTLRRINTFMRKIVKSTTTWAVVPDNGDGTTGPFLINVSPMNHTTINQVTLP